MTKTEYISIAQLAKILGISRIAVYKKVKKGQMPAVKIGRSFAIEKEYVQKHFGDILDSALKKEDKQEIEKAVDKTIEEYGEVLRRLGTE